MRYLKILIFAVIILISTLPTASRVSMMRQSKEDITVSSDPVGAETVINSKIVGTTPEAVFCETREKENPTDRITVGLMACKNF